jgi:hypothetical protein
MREKVEWTASRADLAGGDSQVSRGSRQAAVAEQQLDGPHIRAGFQQVDCESVAQGLLILLMICTQQRFAIGVIPSVA